MMRALTRLLAFASAVAQMVIALGLALGLTSAFIFPAGALDLNAYRAQHKRPPLRHSATLAGIAYEQAHAMASRRRIDHKDFRKRIGPVGTTHAENVSVGCDDEDCAIRQWARSAGHRRNMLRGDVSAYGLASARGDNGRRYWALELGGE